MWNLWQEASSWNNSIGWATRPLVEYWEHHELLVLWCSCFLVERERVLTIERGIDRTQSSPTRKVFLDAWSVRCRQYNERHNCEIFPTDQCWNQLWDYRVYYSWSSVFPNSLRYCGLFMKVLKMMDTIVRINIIPYNFCKVIIGMFSKFTKTLMPGPPLWLVYNNLYRMSNNVLNWFAMIFFILTFSSHAFFVEAIEIVSMMQKDISGR